VLAKQVRRFVVQVALASAKGVSVIEDDDRASRAKDRYRRPCAMAAPEQVIEILGDHAGHQRRSGDKSTKMAQQQISRQPVSCAQA
jgi:hypothetical protein